MPAVLCGRRTDQWPRRLFMQLIPQQLLVRVQEINGGHHPRASSEGGPWEGSTKAVSAVKSRVLADRQA